jgi:glutamate 5-kinase
VSEAVVKLGSNLVADETGLNQSLIDGYAAGLKQTFIEQDKGLIIVTSGAVAAGLHRAERMFNPDQVGRMSSPQLASLGATAVFNAWEQAFEEIGVAAASVPVTHRQLSGGPIWHRLFNREEKRTFATTLYQNRESGIATILNEADAISVTELMLLKCGGENDGLASHVAIAVEADELWLFTRKGGIFDDDGNLIQVVDRSNHHDVQRMVDARFATSKEGRGGASTKTSAALRAARKGIAAHIAQPNPSMTGEKTTFFVW